MVKWIRWISHQTTPVLGNSHLKCLIIKLINRGNRRELKWIDVRVTEWFISNILRGNWARQSIYTWSTALVIHRQLLCSTWADCPGLSACLIPAFTIKLWIEKLADLSWVEIITELTDEKCKNCSNLSSHEWINFDHSKSSVVDITLKIRRNPNIL